MTDKTAIEKARSALSRAGSLLANQGYPTEYIREALADLEADKPAEDAYNLAVKLQTEIGCGVLIDSVAEMIEQFAVAYHVERCKACKALPEVEG